MSNSSISTVFEELFSTPLESVAKSENDYRKIWANWIAFQIPLFRDSNLKLSKEAIDKMFELAPVVKLDGIIDVGITMRIAEVSKKEGELKAGLKVGPIFASGSFGFSKETSQESVFQASTRFTISNQESNLKEYLSARNMKPDNEKDLMKTIEKLKTNGEKSKIDG